MNWFDNIHEKPMNTAAGTEKIRVARPGVLRANGNVARAIQNLRTGANYADGSSTIYGSMGKGGAIGSLVGLLIGMFSKKSTILCIIVGAGAGAGAGFIVDKVNENKNKNKEEN